MNSLILTCLTCFLAGAQGAQFLASSQRKRVDSRWNTIWTFWDYPNGPSPFVQLNVDTWRKHNPDMKLVFLNNSNMKDYVPDLPEEYYRLPYPSAKSDFVRAAVLYHQGGVYMDTDFLLMKPLNDILEMLESYDIVGYSDESSRMSGDCGDHFSSNFMAAKRGNGFSQTWWKNVRSKLTRQCGRGEMACEKVCCNEQGAPGPERRPCHIPWAQLELLKMPWEDADRRPGGAKLDPTNPKNRDYIENGQAMCKDLHLGRHYDASANVPAKNIPSNVTTYCLKGDENLTPHLNGEVYWQPWDHETASTLLGRGRRRMREYDDRFNCSLSGFGEMNCNRGHGMGGDGPLRLANFFNRTAYHLFFSTRSVHGHTKEEILQGDWVVSEMYRRALGVKKKD